MRDRLNILEVAAGGIVESFDPELIRAFDVADQTVPNELRRPENVRLNPDRFRVSGDGMFYTIQGEGITMGLPVVFLRLHVCNLRCVWCDAYYTWNPKSPEFWTESREMTVNEVAIEANHLWGAAPGRGKRLVITGGEPLLQSDLIDQLLDILPEWDVEIETNGTRMPSKRQFDRCQFNCSPKLANSGNSAASRIHSDVLSSINAVNSQFKFVVMHPDDVAEIEQDFLPFIDRDKVVLMPQGVTPEEVTSNARRIVEIAKIGGYRLLGRLHVDIWGAKRRV